MKRMRRTAVGYLAGGVFAFGLATTSPLSSQAALCVWEASETNVWEVAGNWSGGQLPEEGDEVLIANGGSVLVTSSTPALASLVLTNGSSLIFSNWTTIVTAMEVVIASNATVTSAGPFTNAPDMSNRVHIVCSNLTLLPGGQINVSGKGYKGGDLGKNGNGPGGGFGSTWVPGGGGHGGYGGRMAGYDWQFGGFTYGNALTPETPGSGGGGFSGAPGTAGGGAVRIAASGRVTVNGVILADGVADNGLRVGTGSGGSIYITCRTLVGSGRISACGGRATYAGTEAGSGGGGRIAVINDPAAQQMEPLPFLSFHATEGLRNNYPECRGGIGSIYLIDSRFLAANLTNVFGRLEGPSTLYVDNLTVTNQRFGFGRDIEVVVSNHVVVSGSWARLELACSDVMALGAPHYRTAPVGGLRFRVGGNLILTNAARMVVGSGPLSQPAIGTGTLVSVAGHFALGTGCWVEVRSDPTNGASPAFVCGSLTVHSNSGFTAGPWTIGGEWTNTAGGFAAAWANVSFAGSGNTRWGWGPGGGYAGGGAGHGGGGYPYAGQGGITNDSPDAPFWPGSGGGCGNNNWGGGGIGGGLIRITVNETARFRGGSRVEADGGSGRRHQNSDRVGGGGAGGGIYIRCRTFEAENNVRFTARGGMAALNTGGGGGGGRIAIWRLRDFSTGTVLTDVSGGQGRYLNADAPQYDGEAGTVVWGWLRGPGTLIYLR